MSAPAPVPAVSTGAIASLRRRLALDLLDNRYPALHGLRVLAILSVIQFHITWVFSGEQGIRLDRGFVAASMSVFFGMDLFFVLSGFLIGSILLHALETEGAQQLGREGGLAKHLRVQGGDGVVTQRGE